MLVILNSVLGLVWGSPVARAVLFGAALFAGGWLKGYSHAHNAAAVAYAAELAKAATASASILADQQAQLADSESHMAALQASIESMIHDTKNGAACVLSRAQLDGLRRIAAGN